MDSALERFVLPEDLKSAVSRAKWLCFPESREELLELCFGPTHASRYEVSYLIPGRGLVREAEVVRCKNGAAVNFTEDYMRRRDPDCMRIGDELPSDKPRFREVYGYDFSALRAETMGWLESQGLILLPFRAGGPYFGYEALLVCPANAGFFALALADMQGFVGIREIRPGYRPRAILYAAPPFRHTHFDGRQVVVHQRSEKLHEVFAYNLYPGPSAKKGVFSVLLDIGEREGWVVNHASAAALQTPYENEVVFLHEGASGGGKSEMLEELRREKDGRVLLGTDLVSGEKYDLKLGESCRIRPIADDMVLARPAFQEEAGRLVIADAEDGWFLRMDGDRCYGCSPDYERISIHPAEPLLFFNLEGIPGATCLLWEHTVESTGKPCSNPRVILPRRMIEGVLPGDRTRAVDVRSFGVRMPPSTAAAPDYGVMGLLQLVPASLAWLWRLVSPRGFRNPSIADSGLAALQAEGVGSYWPFCTGKKLTQANLLLRQMLQTPETLNVLIPNQHIGAYRIGFMGEWIAREYLARRGGTLRERELRPARCPLFGFSPEELRIDGQSIRPTFLRPELQSRLGPEGYDAGARILTDFMKEQVSAFLTDGLDPVGRRILEACLSDAPLEAYLEITPMNLRG